MYKLSANIDAKDLVSVGTTFRRALRDFLPVLWRGIDADITDHVHQQWKGRSWQSLSGITQKLREDGLDREFGGDPNRPSHYYSQNSPSVNDPTGSRSFGWTLILRKDTSRFPGKFTGFRYTRDFGGSTRRGRMLRWFHFGATVTVTAKMRAFLHAIGIHLSPSTTELVRPPRPIYQQRELDRIVNTRTEQFATRLVQILDPSRRGIRFAIVRGT